jgi:hypothetical protein
MQISGRTPNRLALAIFIVAGLALIPVSADQSDQADLASQIDIVGPVGSGRFGRSVTALPNGNIVVTDPDYDAGTTVDVGAVYLYDGATGALISTLTGSTAGDQVGYDGVTVLSNGNYVVVSHYWDNGGATDAGAVTWGDGTIGVSGVVSLENSLVGKKTGDQVGYRSGGVTALSNGNYVVRSPYWDNGDTMNVGAVTWGDGTIGVSGVVSSTNSLVGSTASDTVGNEDIVALSNGNYVVRSPYWDNAAAEVAVATNAGAVTWGDGMNGTSGAVSSSNSLVGNEAHDRVGSGGVTALSNGNYVASSSEWDNDGVTDAGAATWGNGETGTSGVVSSTNSLVGSTTNNRVGWQVTALSNGNYVVRSPSWSNGGIADVGAATWGDGMTGTSGVVSSTNSLVGSTANDQVGLGVVALSNGNYVVLSRYWDNGGAMDAGAATWGDGTIGTSGVVSSTNSLVGSTANDRVGDNGVAALSNGNYVVSSPGWDNGGVADVGAATWGDGTTGISGAVSSSNSLVGSTANDQVGLGVAALSNGNYVVRSRYWDSGGVTGAGAATWGDGTIGVSGIVSSTNSLVGSTANDWVGYAVTALSNGNYVVCSRYWDNGEATDAGVATWGDGTAGISGAVSADNSLVGSTADDRVGGAGVTTLSNGNYVVSSPEWDNGGVADVGAVTWGDGTIGVSGVVSSTNSLVGSTTGDRLGSGTDGSPIALSDGHYLTSSPDWDNGGVTDAGAVTWGDGTRGVRGSITGVYSVRGTAAGGGEWMVLAYDDTNVQLIVGWPAENTVSLLRPPYIRVWVPLVLRNSAP